LQGKLVVGADGVHSIIQEIIGMPPAIDTGNTVFCGNLICQSGVPNEDSSGDYDESHYKTSLLSSLLAKGPFPFDLRDSDKTYFSMFNHNESNPGLLLWALGTPQQIKGASVDKLFGLFQNQNKDRKSIFNKILQNTDCIQKTKLCVQDMMNLPVNGGWGGRNRVTLIGDAAHACRPTHAQGANMAFEDCAVLCQMLIAARTEIDATASCN
jgi:2-polyprenyl-6-methoxyphenol hydroxylase-like FAD-dependent oxidoreductase